MQKELNTIFSYKNQSCLYEPQNKRLVLVPCRDLRSDKKKKQHKHEKNFLAIQTILAELPKY